MGWVVVSCGLALVLRGTIVVGMDGLGGSSVTDYVFGSWVSWFPQFLSLNGSVSVG